MSRVSWDPSQYLIFADERLRPGFELLARIGDLPAGPLYELGCGTGAHARAIAARWPDRKLTAIDQSAEMLRQAASEPTPAAIEWVRAEIAGWSAPEPAALIFSNATLHWVPDHTHLFPHLLRQMLPGGVLAVQMPRNFREPSHRIVREVAASEPFAAKLAPLRDPATGILRPDPVAMPETYYDLITPLAREGLDIWETEYLMTLEGEDPLVAWTKGSILRPILALLDEKESDALVALLRRRWAEAYPRRPDGSTIFPFRRVFIVARV